MNNVQHFNGTKNELIITLIVHSGARPGESIKARCKDGLYQVTLRGLGEAPKVERLA